MPPHLLNQVAHTTQYFEYNMNNGIHDIVFTHPFCSLEWEKHKWVTMGEACYFVIKAICFWVGEYKWKSSGACNETLTPTPTESKNWNNFTSSKNKHFLCVHLSTLLSTYKPHNKQILRGRCAIYVFSSYRRKTFNLHFSELLYNSRSTLHLLL